MISEDIEYLRTKPNFKKYLDGGSQVRTIRTIYPSVTYPAHVSMMTGCYPEKTGVCSNFAFTTNSKEDTWLWFHENVKCGDIFTAAKPIFNRLALPVSMELKVSVKRFALPLTTIPVPATVNPKSNIARTLTEDIFFIYVPAITAKPKIAPSKAPRDPVAKSP